MKARVSKIEPRIGKGDEHYSWQSSQGGKFYDFIITLDTGERVVASAKSTTFKACQVGDTILYDIKKVADGNKLATIGNIRVDIPPQTERKSNDSFFPTQEETTRMVALESAIEVCIAEGNLSTDAVMVISDEFVKWLDSHNNTKAESMKASNALRRAVSSCVFHKKFGTDTIIAVAKAYYYYIETGKNPSTK